MTTTRTCAALWLGAVLAAGGCTNPAPDARPAPSRPAASSASPSASTSAASASATPAPAGRVASKYARLLEFSVPGTGVDCVMDRNGVECDVAGQSWTPPPREPGCATGTPDEPVPGVRLAFGPATWRCGPGTSMRQSLPLPHGETVTLGLFRCASAADGVRCGRAGTRDGFHLSRRDYALASPTVTPAPEPDSSVDAGIAGKLEFLSPTGNVQCVMNDVTVAACDISRFTFSPPPRPRDCGDGRYPVGAEVRPSGASLTCQSIVEAHEGMSRLPYGESLELPGGSGTLRCTSRTDGVECVITGTPRRFLLGSTRYELS